MFADFLDLLPYAIGITVGILLPAVVIARQEISIEGPFGWSSLTFTRRYPVNHWFSKIYRYITGEDKWATSYHITSNTIWLLIYFLSFLYIPIFSKFAGYSNSPALIGTFVLAITSFIQLTWVEDFIWFLIHPYYGPDRHNPEYVPWFTDYKGGIPVRYWMAMVVGIVITVLTAFLLKKPEIFIIWLEVMVLIIVVCFGVIRPLSKKIQRMPLEKFWWRYVKYVVVERCPYYIEEKRGPLINNKSYVIDEMAMREMTRKNKILPLETVLGTRHYDQM